MKSIFNVPILSTLNTLVFLALFLGSFNARAWLPPVKDGYGSNDFIINRGTQNLAFLDSKIVLYNVPGKADGPSMGKDTENLRSYDLDSGLDINFASFTGRFSDLHRFLNVLNGEVFRHASKEIDQKLPQGFVGLDHYSGGVWKAFTDKHDQMSRDGVAGVYLDQSNRVWLSEFAWNDTNRAGGSSGLKQLKNMKEYFPPDCPNTVSNPQYRQIQKIYDSEFDVDPWFVGYNRFGTGQDDWCKWLMHYDPVIDDFKAYLLNDKSTGMPARYVVWGRGVANQDKIWFPLYLERDKPFWHFSVGFIAFNKNDLKFEEPIFGDIGRISEITLDLNGLPVAFNLDGFSVRVDLNNRIVFRKILTPKTPPSNQGLYYYGANSVSTGADGSLWYFFGDNYYGNQGWTAPGNELHIVRETPAGNLIRFPVIMEDPRDIAWNTQGDFAIRFLGRKVLFYDSITEEFRDLPIW